MPYAGICTYNEDSLNCWPARARGPRRRGDGRARDRRARPRLPRPGPAGRRLPRAGIACSWQTASGTLPTAVATTANSTSIVSRITGDGPSIAEGARTRPTVRATIACRDGVGLLAQQCELEPSAVLLARPSIEPARICQGFCVPASRPARRRRGPAGPGGASSRTAERGGNDRRPEAFRCLRQPRMVLLVPAR